MSEKNWQEGQDPEKYSEWELKDGRCVRVEGVNWFASPAQRIEIYVTRRAGDQRRRGPRHLHMSVAGFWKRVERQL